MPANYKFICNRRKRTDSAGKASVELRITLNRKTKYIATGIRIEPKYWDETKTQVRKTHGNYLRINFIINEILQKVKDAEFKFITEKVNYDLDTLVQVIKKKSNAPMYFPDWCFKVLESKGHLKNSTKKITAAS